MFTSLQDKAIDFEVCMVCQLNIKIIHQILDDNSWSHGKISHLLFTDLKLLSLKVMGCIRVYFYDISS